ncbi:hypothetical protein [Nonomuraea sp. NPDC050202]|uniref:hypothetical protein n=1 Tax=Nonomuraea sp. NPDC050202 TaxID=3155035 RepID=UPI003403FB3A
MSRPLLPGVEPRTPEEKAARDRYRAARDVYYGLQRRLADRTSHDETASPYDLVADALFYAFADKMYEALSSPDFAQELEERGLRVGPALDEGVPPAAPEEWAFDVMGFADPDGTPTDPLELIDRLYADAWRAGWEACAAALAAGQRRG